MKASSDTTTRDAHKNKMAISALLNPSEGVEPTRSKSLEHSHPATLLLQYQDHKVYGHFERPNMSHREGNTRFPHRSQSYPRTCSPTIPGSYVSDFSRPGNLSGQRLKHTGSRGKKTYSREEVDFIRYMKEDCRYSFDEVQRRFMATFPRTSQLSTQGLSSRLYRDNPIPRRDKNNIPIRNRDGNVIWDKFNVRSRSSPRGEDLYIPYTLVDMSPWRAVRYTWVSDEHKKLAQLILDGKDPSDPLGGKAS